MHTYKTRVQRINLICLAQRSEYLKADVQLYISSLCHVIYPVFCDPVQNLTSKIIFIHIIIPIKIEHDALISIHPYPLSPSPKHPLPSTYRPNPPTALLAVSPLLILTALDCFHILVLFNDCFHTLVFINPVKSFSSKLRADVQRLRKYSRLRHHFAPFSVSLKVFVLPPRAIEGLMLDDYLHAVSLPPISVSGYTSYISKPQQRHQGNKTSKQAS